MKNKQDSKDNTLKPLKMENNKNLFVIPTNNPSRVYGILGSYRLGLTSNDPFYTENFGGGTQNQNVYVTSNEEIKDGEYGICLYLVKEGFKSHQAVFKMDSEQRLAMEELGGQKKAQVLKVILTQDQDLIKDGVQPIPDEFLVWFVEKVNDSGKPIDIVEVDKVGLVSDNGRVLYGIKYKIIIPQEAVRPYSAEQYDSEITPILKEQRKKFKVMIVGDGKPQQETLEQVAERILANNIDGLRDALKDDDLFFFYKGVIQCYGEAMAEWQKEQDLSMVQGYLSANLKNIELLKNSFSEEDMREMYNKSCGKIGLGELNDQTENNNRFREFIQEIKNK